MLAGLHSCGINVHMLLHLPFFVRCYGPLWTHSAFPFEGQMGHFLRHSHATHGISKQVPTIKYFMYIPEWLCFIGFMIMSLDL